MKVAIITILCIVAFAVVVLLAYNHFQKCKNIRKLEEENGIEHTRRTFKQWLADHVPSKRRLVQVYAALLYNANIKGFISGDIYTGNSKFMCVPGLNCYSCPGAVGACPLGSFQNALAESKVRAPYYIIGILGIFGLTLARTICGWLCPVGLGQELLYKIRTPKLKKNRVTRVLSYFKYVILFVLVIIVPLLYALRDVPLPAFCKYICPAGTIGGAISMLLNPNNVDLYEMLGGQFVWKFGVLIVFIVASIFIFRFFCRFFCPLGAIYGFFNKIALIGVKVDKEKCIDCGKCVEVCKMDVKHVGDHECINCGKCVSCCPTHAIRWKGVIKQEKGLAIETTANNEILQPVRVSDSVVKLTTNNIDSADMPSSSRSQLLNYGSKKLDASFWIRLVATIIAIVLLVSSLVYYNFIAVESENKPNSDIGYQVGMTAPDFTVALYGSEQRFCLYDNRGKFTVINFWATWCTPCVTEIPYFDQLAKENNNINVIAIHGSSTRDVQEFINNNWSNHSLIFGQDNLEGKKCLTFSLFGGTTIWPLTVIVDTNGKVVYNSTQSFKNYEQLKQLVDSFVNN